LLRDLGQVQMGVLERKGIFGINDNDDSVSGIVLLLRGENPSRVLEGIHKKVVELNGKILPTDTRGRFKSLPRLIPAISGQWFDNPKSPNVPSRNPFQMTFANKLGVPADED
jgi:hypothetical protein